MKRSLDHYLNLLRAYDPLTEEQHAAIDARVRRDVLARFGGFHAIEVSRLRSTPLETTRFAEIPTAPRTGMLVLLRPAFALAGVAAVAAGAVLALQRSGWGPFRAQGIRQPVVTPSAEVVAVATPIVPGSGVAVSVFGITPLRVRGDEGELRIDRNPSQPPLIQRGGARVPPLRVRGGKGALRSGRRPINPASGVFDQWGESVFSEEGLLQNERDGKNVFNS